MSLKKMLWAAVLLLAANAAYSAIILSTKDIFQKRVSFQALPDGSGVVTLSGLAGHSAYVVESYTVTRLGADEQLLLVRLVPAKRGFSGGFRISVAVTKGDAKLFFGEDCDLVWAREAEAPGAGK